MNVARGWLDEVAGRTDGAVTAVQPDSDAEGLCGLVAVVVRVEASGAWRDVGAIEARTVVSVFTARGAGVRAGRQEASCD